MIKTLNEIVKEKNRVVAGWLLYYPERKQHYEEKRENILHASPSVSLVSFAGEKGNITDKTGKKGSKLGDLHKQEKWLKLVEDVEEMLPDNRKVYLALRREYRYYKGRKGWTGAVQYKFSVEMAKRLGFQSQDANLFHRNTHLAWWNDIVNQATVLAAERGLFG